MTAANDPPPERRAEAGDDARPRVEVREATAHDLDLVLELRLALLAEHSASPIYGRLRADVRERARRLYRAQLAAEGEVIFLAASGGRTVGILRCMDAMGSALLEPQRYGYISSVYVRPHARRAGVLRALMDAAERWCMERGLTELRLHNAADNEEAGATWERLGFEVVEVLRMRSLPGPAD